MRGGLIYHQSHHLSTQWPALLSSSGYIHLPPVVLTAGRGADWVIRSGRSHSPVWCPNQNSTSCRVASRITPSLCSRSATGITAPTSGGLSGRRNSVWKVRRCWPQCIWYCDYVHPPGQWKPNNSTTQTRYVSNRAFYYYYMRSSLLNSSFWGY